MTERECDLDKMSVDSLVFKKFAEAFLFKMIGLLEADFDELRGYLGLEGRGKATEADLNEEEMKSALIRWNRDGLVDFERASVDGETHVVRIFLTERGKEVCVQLDETLNVVGDFPEEGSMYDEESDVDRLKRLKIMNKVHAAITRYLG